MHLEIWTKVPTSVRQQGWLFYMCDHDQWTWVKSADFAVVFARTAHAARATCTSEAPSFTFEGFVMCRLEWNLKIERFPPKTWFCLKSSASCWIDAFWARGMFRNRHAREVAWGISYLRSFHNTTLCVPTSRLRAFLFSSDFPPGAPIKVSSFRFQFCPTWRTCQCPGSGNSQPECSDSVISIQIRRQKATFTQTEPKFIHLPRAWMRLLAKRTEGKGTKILRDQVKEGHTCTTLGHDLTHFRKGDALSKWDGPETNRSLTWKRFARGSSKPLAGSAGLCLTWPDQTEKKKACACTRRVVMAHQRWCTVHNVRCQRSTSCSCPCGKL